MSASKASKAADAAKVGAAAAKGAAAGGLAGAATGAAKQTVSVALKSPKAKKWRARALVAAVVALLLTVSSLFALANMLGGSASTKESKIRERAGHTAVDSGMPGNQLSYLTAEADAAGLPWEIPASLLFLLTNSGGGASAAGPGGTGGSPGLANSGIQMSTGAEQVMQVYTTGYTWQDNTPPGSAEIALPVVHTSAGGTGTYTDPITLAVGAPGNHWVLPAGTRFYVPYEQRYFVTEDTGDDFMATKVPSPGRYWLDLWVGGQGATKSQSDACASAVTGIHTAIMNPNPNYPVGPGAGVMQGTTCDTGHGETATAGAAPSAINSSVSAQTGDSGTSSSVPGGPAGSMASTFGIGLGGIGPWHLSKEAAAKVPAPLSPCPENTAAPVGYQYSWASAGPGAPLAPASTPAVSAGVAPTPTPSASPDPNAAGFPGATDFCQSTRWVMHELRSQMVQEPTLDARLSLGDGSSVGEDGIPTWTDPQAMQDRLVVPYGKVLAKTPIPAITEQFGQQVATQAIYWHLGVPVSCGAGVLGASGAAVSAQGWTNPGIDADGIIQNKALFGWRIQPITGLQEMHPGVDMSNDTGKPIWAAAAGVVTRTGDNGEGGNSVTIDHGGGIVTKYMHQSRIIAVVGQKVVPGQQIGYVGSTGLSTQPHLHFQVEQNGTPIDPQPFMTARGVDLKKPAASFVLVPGPGGTVVQAGSVASGTPAPATTAAPSSAPSAAPSPATTPGATPAPATGAAPTTISSHTADGQPYVLNQVQVANAQAIIQIGRGAGASDAILAEALMSAMAESDLRMLASAAVPESMTMAHDAVEPADKDSVGIFQERPSMGWGTVAQLMDRTYQIQQWFGTPLKNAANSNPGAFDRLKANPGLINTPGALSQAVEVSDFPDRYRNFAPVAADILAQVSGAAGATGGFCSPMTGSAGTAVAVPNPAATPSVAASTPASVVNNSTKGR